MASGVGLSLEGHMSGLSLVPSWLVGLGGRAVLGEADLRLASVTGMTYMTRQVGTDGVNGKISLPCDGAWKCLSGQRLSLTQGGSRPLSLQATCWLEA